MKHFQLLPVILVIFLANTVQAEILPQAEDTVRIGLMLSEDPQTDINSRVVLFTVQYVADRINEEGGLNGRNLDIIFKSGDGDWGISSKRSVELIFDHEVSAIIGSLDGQNAHLTQMAITKAEVVYLATRSTDPTLSEINIPWFFRVIPSDKQQAETLIQDIYFERGLNNIAVIHSNRYDHRMSANTFNRLASETHQFSIQTIEFDRNNTNFKELNPSLKYDELGGIVFFGSGTELKLLISEMEQNGKAKPVFLPITDFSNLISAETTNEINYVCTQNWPIQFDPSFENRFKEEFQRKPGFIAAYSYDGIRVLIDTILKSGDGRRQIRDRLADTVRYQGLTGMIGFENNGDIKNLTGICIN